MVALVLVTSACQNDGEAGAAPLPGLDSRHDVLLRACEAGSLEECEQLYWDVAPDSEYAVRALAMIPADALADMLARQFGENQASDAPTTAPSAPGSIESSGNLDPDGEPYYETLRLSAGFSDDPRLIEVHAGGLADASFLPSECQGAAIGFRPDVRLLYQAGSVFPLNIYAFSPSDDLVLVVQLPGGRFVCNDDYSNFNPAILLESPSSGTYNIWVGVYGEGYGDGTLAISELTPRFR